VSVDLTLIWAVVVAGAVVMYVLLDGFDLGVGILFPTARDEAERDTMMASIAPVWDGNETWLVLGGAGLLAAFPAAYAMLLPALFVPLMVMLIGLVLRGVAFEFRARAMRKAPWNAAFAGGSLVAAACQGIVVGTVVQGIAPDEGAWHWLTPFCALTGVAVPVGYALLGATWLHLKTEGSLQARTRRQGFVLLAALLAAIGAVSLWTPLAQPAVAQRWFSLPNFYYLSQVPLATLVLAAGCAVALRRGRERSAFLCAAGLFLLAYAGLVISVWPYVVPRTLTFWEAAAAPSTQRFTLIGLAITLPFVLGYTVLGYRSFAGKVQAGSGYH
jgi:cytochrome bd ubiquinol oxidase subunit II